MSILRFPSLLSLAVLASCSPLPKTGAEEDSSLDASAGLDAKAEVDTDASAPLDDAEGSTTASDGGANDGESPSHEDGAAPSPEDASFDANVPDALPAGYTGTPFGGTPATIPGAIALSNYDLGGEGIAYHDTGAAARAYAKCGLTRSDGVNLDCTDARDLAFPACTAATAGEVYLAYIGNGEWFNYTVDVEEAATFAVSAVVATSSATTKISITFSPSLGTGTITLPSDVGCAGHEAYHNWGTAADLAEVTLAPGRYVMTLTIVSQGMNLDSVTFTKK